MNILVTGANGQLGNEMRIVAKNTSDNYIFTDVNEVEGLETTYLDITDIDAIRKMVKEHDINAIVNCAAWTNVDACETDEKLAALAEKLNADAPENLAKVMKEVDGWLIQISTDYVFGKEPYNVPCGPDQKGTPTGVYGTTKLHGEQKIIATGCKYVIIRTAWLYSEFGKNFCKTMLALTASKPQLKVVFDQCGTPTYAGDLAAADVILTANTHLKKALTPLLPEYDFILIDCPASYGRLTMNALTAATSAIITLEPAAFSEQGIDDLADIIKQIRRTNKKLNVRGILITRCDKRSNEVKQAIEDIRAAAAAIGTEVLEPPIRATAKVGAAQRQD